MRPHETFHVRELARQTGFPAGTVNRQLKRLADAGLLTSRQIGNQVHYQANPECIIYAELAAIFRKTTGLADVLGEALAPLSKKIKAAFVFGSLAAGNAKPGSDVDLFVVGRLSLKDVVSHVSSLHLKLGREINPVIMTPAKLRSAVKKKDRFISRLMDEPKIFVQGTHHEFEQFSKNRPIGNA
ncbi:MAG: nucleotidyltransferase domain-containing protein [Gammaproteobacteria bacterium]|nr:nucleotidyltransferase domain-containing protein [Gammaproteobacteria bacterium]